MFVAVPGRLYNELRAQMLEQQGRGEEPGVRALVFRRIPVPEAIATGVTQFVLSYTYLGQQGFEFNATPRCWSNGDGTSTCEQPLIGWILRKVTHFVVELVDGLSETDLQTTVPACPLWSVHDLVAHLCGTAEAATHGAFFDGAAEAWADDGLAELREAWTAAQVEARRDLDQQQTLERFDGYTRQAYEMVVSGKVQKAFNVAEESDETRNTYGRVSVGEKALMARRLVEAGVTFVLVSGAWGYFDHHGDDVRWGAHAVEEALRLGADGRGVDAVAPGQRARGEEERLVGVLERGLDEAAPAGVEPRLRLGQAQLDGGARSHGVP